MLCVIMGLVLMIVLIKGKYIMNNIKTLAELETENSEGFKNPDNIVQNSNSNAAIKTLAELENESSEGFKNPD